MTATRATSDSRLSGIDHRVVTHDRVGSLEEAAAARGLPSSSVIKTLVVRRTADSYVFVLVPGDRVIDWPKLRAVLGERRLSMPHAEEAFRVTGYERGTITPFGSTHHWPVVADEALQSESVSIGGGAKGVSITIATADLMRILDALVADVTRSP